MNNITLTIVIVCAVVIGAFTVYFATPNMTDSNASPTVAENGDLVSVHYTGKLTDGTKFDSSIDRGKPFSFILGSGMVIRGWDEGIAGMKKGQKKTLEIPYDKAYGALGVADGRGGYIIPPNSDLVFDVELVDIQRK